MRASRRCLEDFIILISLDMEQVRQLPLGKGKPKKGDAVHGSLLTGELVEDLRG